MNKIEYILNLLPENIREYVKIINEHENITEIRLRRGKRLRVVCLNEEYTAENIFIMEKEINETINKACEYSLYAYENELREGYIAIKGGNRIGICGEAIMENNQVKNITHITSLNIRIANELKGISDSVMKYIVKDREIYNTVIISPPGLGKTTLLRDIIRNAAMHFNVGVIDERGELGASHLGVAGNDLGEKVDILDGCKKIPGINILLRSMAPRIIAVDEIGNKEDLTAIKYAGISGCAIFATAHAGNLEEFLAKGFYGIFDRHIILSEKKGNIQGIYDREGKKINA